MDRGAWQTRVHGVTKDLNLSQQLNKNNKENATRTRIRITFILYIKFLKNNILRLFNIPIQNDGIPDFSGCPVAWTLDFHCRGHWFEHWSGN